MSALDEDLTSDAFPFNQDLRKPDNLCEDGGALEEASIPEKEREDALGIKGCF